MDANNTFKRFAGITAIFSCPVAFLSLWLILSAFDFDVDIASNPARAIAYAPDPSLLIFWGWIFDIFGYYLPLIPLLIFLQHTFSSTHPLQSKFAFFCGSAYVVTDALGAAMLAGTTVFLFNGYHAEAGNQDLYVSLYGLLNSMVFSGIWNILGYTFAACFWIGTGALFLSSNKGLAYFSYIVGLAQAVDVLGNLFNAPFMAGIGLNIYLLTAPVWALMTGLWILKMK